MNRFTIEEMEYPDTEDYYSDIDDFVMNEVTNRFGKED